MSILAKIKQLASGASAITEWLGEGGSVVDQNTAQERANICLKCPKHNPDQNALVLFAEGVRKVLSVKNDIGLEVENEDKLGSCSVCGCVLKLQVFEPKPALDKNDVYDPSCWKLKL